MGSIYGLQRWMRRTSSCVRMAYQGMSTFTLKFIVFSHLLPCNHQLSKSIVHEIKFGDYSCRGNINYLPYSDRYFDTDWQFEMFKRRKPMDMILVKCIF